jgi:hypothetical protein
MTPFVRLWICLSVFASFAGWALSALGQLNRTGYTVGFAIFILFLVWQWKPLGLVPGRINFRRFRRPLPFCFAALAALIFLGGVLYPPSNYTGLTYHVPRVLQWLSHDGWFWIHTPVVRMNFSGCDFEWLNAPLLLFTRSDRALFLLNFIPFLLLPGLVFSVFTRLGVRPKVAWQWMWLLPTGYIFMLQAGSIVNDAFNAMYALAAIDFGCRAWESHRLRDLFFSLLAIALMTGTKATSLPLLLPWLVLVFRLLPLLRQRWPVTLLIMTLSADISFFPLALMNKIHCGDWLGTSTTAAQLEISQPLAGIIGNAFQLTLDNFVPPVFPLAGWWNVHAPLMMPRFITDAVNANFDTGFFTIGELPTEDWAGVGFGLSLLLVISILVSLWKRKATPQFATRTAIPSWLCRCVLLAAWISLLAYSVKSGLTTAARLVAPYYALLIPSLLISPALSKIVRCGWWRALTGIVLISAFTVLIMSPDRPLWPAKTILSKLHEQHPQQRLVTRALNVYTVYSEHSDALAGVRALLPQNITTVGFIGTADDSDISLWRPFGKRRVEHFLLTDPTALIRRQVEYVVMGGCNLKEKNMTLETWLQQSGAELVATTNATLKVSEGSQPWYVTRLNP